MKSTRSYSVAEVLSSIPLHIESVVETFLMRTEVGAVDKHRCEVVGQNDLLVTQ